VVLTVAGGLAVRAPRSPLEAGSAGDVDVLAGRVALAGTPRIQGSEHGSKGASVAGQRVLEPAWALLVWRRADEVCGLKGPQSGSENVRSDRRATPAGQRFDKLAVAKFSFHECRNDQERPPVTDERERSVESSPNSPVKVDVQLEIVMTMLIAIGP
jgi:hypothetical protein